MAPQQTNGAGAPIVRRHQVGAARGSFVALGIRPGFEKSVLNSTELRRRVKDRITAWRVDVEHMAETESSVLVFGRREHQPVVLKVIKYPGDEWWSGEVLHAFEGRGVVRIFDYVEGAVLLEHLRPGKVLTSVAIDESDERATEILATVIGKMSPRESVAVVPTAGDLASGFERFEARTDGQVPKSLLEDARRVYSELCASQSRTRLLHGDLHHGNVLLDSERGWLAIDPKGVVGEPEYEVGAALRNPLEKPTLFLQPAAIKARVQCYRNQLHLDSQRILGWTFAQAVLSAIWAVDDGFVVGRDNPWIAFARAVRPMLMRGGDA